ncbi:hypothetical protein LAZ67_10002669 [Cordylochernes scorpioides]|uniref:Uncharacterized protein n=1 Tax=Cordylochernes scorpioides TaxID=51811 RepID=A0ABY6KWR9_9ARAC|nr:hypothetical protein LAZ67_10002669 [Cordylochernes scorpioides]
MFSEGREDVNDKERAGRPSTSTTDEKINEVEKMILANRRITVREVAEDLNISIGSCHSIFINDLGMRRVAAKFVPKLLNCDCDVILKAVKGRKQKRQFKCNEVKDSEAELKGGVKDSEAKPKGDGVKDSEAKPKGDGLKDSEAKPKDEGMEDSEDEPKGDVVKYSEAKPKGAGVRELPPLEVNDRVWLTDLKTPGVIISKADTPRSYMVDTPRGRVRRNRFHLLPTGQRSPGSSHFEPDEEPYVNCPEANTHTSDAPTDVTDSSTSPKEALYRTRSGRTVRPPRHFGDD